MLNAIPTVTRNMLGLVVSTSAKRYSFHATRKEKIPVATSPGSESGRMTRRNALRWVQPSTNAAWSSLATVGGYVYNGGVIVAHASSGYVAVSQACTHQGATIIFDSSTSSFFCPAHGSRFSLTGAVLNGPAGTPLGAYKTSLSGNSLRVYS